MEKSKFLFSLYSYKHKWLADLERLLIQIEKQTDHCGDTLVECSKSFLEAIAKNIIIKLRPYEQEKEINLLDLGRLFKKAKEALLEHSVITKVMPLSDIENFFSALNQWIRFLGEMRNNIGEVSHGKILPKAYSLNIEIAKVLNSITDGFAYLLLSFLVEIDLAYTETYKYSDYEEFNDYLDERYDLPNGLSYSKALFEQDYDAYAEELDNYLDGLDNGK
ncbi:abortive infection family protein [Acinetobacter baumannii]|uniref:abortive infection family protein n=1 Tax=Acinetobacter baumannii TaxID=470 RepID=UPI002449A4BF|nr:abortive infection family protein [Acinetobacter baumannii]MDH2488079.1 abortive infection family protein [Acinetobacter baumannii]